MQMGIEWIALAFLAAATLQQPEPTAAEPGTLEQPRIEQDEPEIIVEEEAPRRICETRHETGSIIPRRICRTPEQVAADEEEARFIKEQLSRDREAARHIQDSVENR